MAKRLKKVPTRIKETPRSAATSLYVFPRKKSFPIGDLFHARLALIYALSPTHAKVADKVFKAVQRAYPQYDWERWWDEHSDEEEYRRVANPMFSDDDFDEDGYFIHPVEHIDDLVRSRSMPSRKVSKFLKERAEDWDVVYDNGDIVGLTFRYYVGQSRIPVLIPRDSKYFHNAFQIMNSFEREVTPRRPNPVATGTLVALGLGYILGSKK